MLSILSTMVSLLSGVKELWEVWKTIELVWSHKSTSHQNTCTRNSNPMADKYHIRHIRNSSMSTCQEHKALPSVTHKCECSSISHHKHNKIDTHTDRSYDYIPNFSQLHFYTYYIVDSLMSIRKIWAGMGHIDLHGFWKSIFYNKRFYIFHNAGFSLDQLHLKLHCILNLDRFFCYQILWLHRTVKFFWIFPLCRWEVLHKVEN